MRKAIILIGLLGLVGIGCKKQPKICTCTRTVTLYFHSCRLSNTTNNPMIEVIERRIPAIGVVDSPLHAIWGPWLDSVDLWPQAGASPVFKATSQTTCDRALAQ